VKETVSIEEYCVLSKCHEFFAAPLYTYGNALINWRGDPTKDLTVFAESYRYAAMNLVADYERRKYGAIDEAALPILFLYRHSFELYLKAIIYRAAAISIDEAKLHIVLPKLWREHSLVALATMAKPVIGIDSGHLLALNGELAEKISDLAGEIDKIDSGSYSFRYPVTSRGTAALPPVFLTNIFVLSQRMETVLDDVAQFCRYLEDVRIQASDQIKLALHNLAHSKA
jgi:hypothetical protein